MSVAVTEQTVKPEDGNVVEPIPVRGEISQESVSTCDSQHGGIQDNEVEDVLDSFLTVVGEDVQEERVAKCEPGREESLLVGEAEAAIMITSNKTGDTIPSQERAEEGHLDERTATGGTDRVNDTLSRAVESKSSDSRLVHSEGGIVDSLLESIEDGSLSEQVFAARALQELTARDSKARYYVAVHGAGALVECCAGGGEALRVQREDHGRLAWEELVSLHTKALRIIAQCCQTLSGRNAFLAAGLGEVLDSIVNATESPPMMVQRAAAAVIKRISQHEPNSLSEEDGLASSLELMLGSPNAGIRRTLGSSAVKYEDASTPFRSRSKLSTPTPHFHGKKTTVLHRLLSSHRRLEHMGVEDFLLRNCIRLWKKVQLLAMTSRERATRFERRRKMQLLRKTFVQWAACMKAKIEFATYIDGVERPPHTEGGRYAADVAFDDSQFVMYPSVHIKGFENQEAEIEGAFRKLSITRRAGSVTSEPEANSITLDNSAEMEEALVQTNQVETDECEREREVSPVKESESREQFDHAPEMQAARRRLSTREKSNSIVQELVDHFERNDSDIGRAELFEGDSPEAIDSSEQFGGDTRVQSAVAGQEYAEGNGEETDVNERYARKSFSKRDGSDFGEDSAGHTYESVWEVSDEHYTVNISTSATVAPSSEEGEGDFFNTDPKRTREPVAKNNTRNLEALLCDEKIKCAQAMQVAEEQAAAAAKAKNDLNRIKEEFRLLLNTHYDTIDAAATLGQYLDIHETLSKRELYHAVDLMDGILAKSGVGLEKSVT